MDQLPKSQDTSDRADGPILFAPGVMSHQAAIGPADFDVSFYYGLLLQAPLLALDTCFFTNPLMRAQFDLRNKLGTTWLATALEVGALRPMYRSGKSFSDTLKGLLKDRFSGVREETASAIAKAFPPTRVAQYERMPSRELYAFGENLERQFLEFFANDDAPITDSLPYLEAVASNEFWDRTERWRTGWVKQAIRQRTETRKATGDGKSKAAGLRLSDILQVAASDLSGGRVKRVQDAREVCKVARKYLNDETRATDVRTLLVLMDLLYFRNFLDGMVTCKRGLGWSTPRWHPLAAYFNVGFMPPSQTDVMEHLDEFQIEDVADKLSEVQLPSLSVLRETPGSVYRRIWDGGQGYFEALWAYRNDRSPENFDELVNQLIPYSRLIIKETRAEEDILKYSVGSFRSEWLNPALIMMSGVIAFYSGAGPAGMAPILFLYPILKSRRRNKVHPIGRALAIGRGARQFTLNF